MAKKTIKLRRNLQRNREIYPEYTKKKKAKKINDKIYKGGRDQNTVLNRRSNID